MAVGRRVVCDEPGALEAAVVTLPPERLTEMRIENDAQLRLLYAQRCWLRREIEFREQMKREWFRASPASQDRATHEPSQSTLDVPDAGGA